MDKAFLQSIELPQSDRKFAVGNDLVKVSEFEKSLNDAFREKVYTANEIEYCNLFSDSLLRYAATWAAKEAVYKALKQLDPALLSFKKIEILRNKIAGIPHVKLHREAKLAPKISLSISHDGDYAWAIAIVEIC